MRLKTYRAGSMADALTAVKKDLGKEAVILHTRSVRVGGLLGFGKRTMIEITAADEPVNSARRAAAGRAKVETVAARAEAPVRPILAATSAARAYQRTSDLSGERAPAAASAMFSAPRTDAKPAGIALPPTRNSNAGESGLSASAATRAGEEPVLMAVRNRRIAEAEAARNAKPPATPAKTAGRPQAPFVTVDASNGGLFRELADIKMLVNQVLHSSPSSSAGVAAGAMPDPLFQHYLRLLEASVSRDIADAVIGAVRDELTPGEMHDESIVRTTVLRHIAGMIPVADSGSLPAARRGEATVIALVGPTGVGKTTTIAKLAAAYKLRHGKTVALITSDTYRIAAVDQLRTYAGIIGLPLKVVMSPEEMGAAVAALRGYDVVLIDTAGRSQFNADRLAELRQFVDAAAPTEVHLVLSSAAAEPVLMRTVESFASLGPDRVILTKLDEAVNFGVIVNVTRRLGTALSFITTGQEVPDDIERGQPDRLARMVLDNALIASSTPGRGPGAGVGAAEREQMLVGAGGGR